MCVRVHKWWKPSALHILCFKNLSYQKGDHQRQLLLFKILCFFHQISWHSRSNRHEDFNPFANSTLWNTAGNCDIAMVFSEDCKDRIDWNVLTFFKSVIWRRCWWWPHNLHFLRLDIGTKCHYIGEPLFILLIETWKCYDYNQNWVWVIAMRQ